MVGYRALARKPYMQVLSARLFGVDAIVRESMKLD